VFATLVPPTPPEIAMVAVLGPEEDAPNLERPVFKSLTSVQEVPLYDSVKVDEGIPVAFPAKLKLLELFLSLLIVLFQYLNFHH
jgi:hypothetical protein